ncbi:hypothetical protein [Amycolatopsis sp. NPDC051716]|uniref:hypothetical protein n=1 Tax=Amycolatopsis sp. NPDC051716 TaxID=3155804 RepID=UPI00344999F7
MEKNDDVRSYGPRYNSTSAIIDLATLADRMLAELTISDNPTGLPEGVRVLIQVRHWGQLVFLVPGLSDDFLFASISTTRYSHEANVLMDKLLKFIESYNWNNPDDMTDRRFNAHIHLLSEDEWMGRHWSTGVATLLR